VRSNVDLALRAVSLAATAAFNNPASPASTKLIEAGKIRTQTKNDSEGPESFIVPGSDDAI
jgi:hypothetical protein